MAKARIRTSSGDLVNIQFAIDPYAVPRGVTLTSELLADMIRRKAITSSGRWNGHSIEDGKAGKDPKGIHLYIKRWQNPDRNTGAGRSWRYAGRDQESQDEAWGSLRLVIASAEISITPIRKR